MNGYKQWNASAACAALALAIVGCGGDGGSEPGATLAVLSSRPDTVSGGDVLVRADLTGTTPSEVSFAVNGTDVTPAAVQAQGSDRLDARIAGLVQGSNTISVKSLGRTLATLQVTNHPASGPIFSGPQQQPWICETASFTLPDGSRLPASAQADCSVPTVVHYVYVANGGTVRHWTPSSTLPADVSQTTTRDGRRVHFVIRVETGTLNRGIYQIALLHDPTTDPAPTPWKQPAGWNGELVFPFGGSCNPGYHQATSLGGSYANKLHELSLGYAVASSTLNVWGNNCNSVLSAESLSMVKERFIETYGVPKATIGQGGSGGAKSQLMIVDAYPGLLDGILPGIQAGGPDGMSANPSTVDCSLLVNYFNVKSTQAWTYAQKTAVAGWRGWNNCERQPDDAPAALPWHGLFSPAYMVATSRIPVDAIGCSAVIPVNLLYHPVTNPGGVRCDLYSNQINVFGPDPAKPNAARRPMDSVGVQYGLAAFNAGTISAEQFVELNERIGGYDVDGNFIDARTQADITAVRIAYRTGQVLHGGGGLNEVPIIDLRRYTEAVPDLHDRLGTFITRERLVAANGNADNLVLFTYPSPAPAGPFGSDAIANIALDEMSRWLAAMRADTADGSAAARVRRNKPSGLADACWDAAGTRIVEPATYAGGGQCNTLYPSFANPRIVAGMSLRHDVLKCQLKPVAASDYARPLSGAQLARLRAAFPDGVCDFSKPGVEQQPLGGTWFAYPTQGNPVALGR